MHEKGHIVRRHFVCLRRVGTRDRGAVALPHGWGHKGGWQVANEHAGVNTNLLASSDPDDLEKLAGMAFLNGIPVRVSPVAREAAPLEPAQAAPA